MTHRALLSHVAILCAAAAVSTGSFAANITGAGATFPYPIYAKWADAYHKATGNGMNYQSIGSGGGIKQIGARTVHFGASDKPLSAADLGKDGLMQFPAIMGGVVPVYNVKGVSAGQITLSGTVLADIYLGKIKRWNDPAIAKMSPGAKLPDRPISVVHRSDGSGTTFLFTNYLSKASPAWKSVVGVGTAVKWPTGVGGKGNEGVANYVGRIAGAIGYVEYAYAKQNKLPHAKLINRDGAAVAPTQDSFTAAAAGADWADTPGMGVILTDQPGRDSWPISGASFILMHVKQDDPAAGEVLMDGENLLDAERDVALLRAKVGMVFQKATPFPMSVYENVAFGVRLFERLGRRDMDERVEWALSRAALWSEVKDKLKQSGNSLSGGQQQRLCIARGIAIRPEVLLLDEPCSALDPISTARIEELIHELKTDYTVVIVTHNMQQAARVSDFTGYMFLGELVEFDVTDTIFIKPKKQQTEDYITGRFG